MADVPFSFEASKEALDSAKSALETKRNDC